LGGKAGFANGWGGWTEDGSEVVGEGGRGMVVGEVTYKTLKEERRYADASPVCYFNGLGDGFGTFKV